MHREIIVNWLVFAVYLAKETLGKWCKKPTVRLTNQDFLTACLNGNKVIVEKYRQKMTELERYQGMRIAVEHRHTELVAFFIKEVSSVALDAKFLGECLVIACKNNCLPVVELLLQAGVEPKLGLRVTKSDNIFALLSRYDRTVNPK